VAGGPFRPSIFGIALAAQAEARRGVTRALSHTILPLVIEMLDTRLMKRGQDEATRQWAAVGLGICFYSPFWHWAPSGVRVTGSRLSWL